ncbi:unnamed protein product [Adineta steineri]|uniref:Uncharacterized protein n=1 Tax=Adineta steineri TaxID=433720 RepID=A0A820C481_9BILA|nr:unnamed protein product [Adineta steineri]CAF4202681.1 unnamed protein product [Adineta steineri]
MTQRYAFSRSSRRRIRDAIVFIRRKGEPNFGLVNGYYQNEQARGIVHRLFDATNVTPREFVELIGSPNYWQFRRWLYYPGDQSNEGFRVIRFLHQILSEIAEEMAELGRQKRNDNEDDGDDENGAAPVIADVSDVIRLKAVKEKKIDELLILLGYICVKDMKSFVECHLFFDSAAICQR